MSLRPIVLALTIAVLAAGISQFREPRVDTASPLVSTPHSPIYINGDGNFTAPNGVTGGSGTPEDPYRIEGWQIDVTSWSDRGAVTLSNTNASVIVEGLFVNVTASDPEIGSPNAVNILSSHNVTVRGVTTTGQNSLVLVDSSSNVTVANCTALNPNQLGVAPEIWVRYSRDVAASGNTLTRGYPGIDVWLSNQVRMVGNEILGNIATGVGGIQVGFSDNVSVMGGRLYSAGIRASSVKDIAVVAVSFEAGASVHVIDGMRIRVEESNLNGGYIRLNYTRDARVAGNHNVSRIWLAYSPSWNTSISLNDVVGGDYGIYGWYANDVEVDGNNVSGMSEYALVFAWSSNVTVTGNRASDSMTGFALFHSDEVLVFHNDFARNAVQALVNASTALRWNESYPTGGNSWSDYSGVDRCSGPLQDVCTGPDGIGDTPYMIDAQNADSYPIMSSTGSDFTAPLIAIAWPSNGTTATSSPIEIRGTASDEGGSGLRDVSVRVNGGVWALAQGLATWSGSVFLTTGSNRIEASARDWAGNVAVATVNVTWSTSNMTVIPILPTSFIGSSNGITVTLSADVSGGAPPYSFLWSFGDGASSTEASPAHTYAIPGPYNVTLTVTDSQDHSVTQRFTLTIPPPTGPVPANPFPLLMAVSIVAVPAAVFLVIVYLVLRSARIRPPE